MGEIRFVGTGETHGYPYLVCKKHVSIPLIELNKETKQKLTLMTMKTPGPSHSKLMM